MAIRFEHEEFVRTSPQRAFALIDNLPQTSKWLPPCVSLEKIGSGPNAVGDTLKYVFKQGGRVQEMAGQIIERKQDERLVAQYDDKMFRVLVDLRVAPATSGAMTTHIIEITPKTFMGRFFTPLIRMGLKKQTRAAAMNLKALLESAQT